MHRQLEPLRQKRPQHLPEPLRCHLVCRLGEDIEPDVVQPIGPDDLEVLYAVCPADAGNEPGIPDGQAGWSGLDCFPARLSGVDGRHFE